MTRDHRRTYLGADFARLWTAFAVSEVGSAVGAGALPLVALLVLKVSNWQVSLLAAVGAIASAVLALPLGPFIEHRRKRPLMMAADLTRAAALASVPLAAWLGHLSFVQLCVVAMLASTGGIVFNSASSAHLKGLVPKDVRSVANSRFEMTSWLATTVGPPIGGVIISMLGATATMLVDGISFIGSALGVRSIRSPEPTPKVSTDQRRFGREIGAGWVHIWQHPGLRALFLNALLFGGAIMLASPLETVLMLRDLGFTPFQYGLALGLPCLGGVLGAWLMPRLMTRYGERRVMLTAGVLRTLWLTPVVFAPKGVPGLLLFIGCDFLLLFCSGVFNPAYITYRMRETPDSHMARVSTAWSISSRTIQPICMVLGGLLLAAATTTRNAIGYAALLLLASALFLPWKAWTRKA